MAVGGLGAVVTRSTGFLATVVCPPFVRDEMKREGAPSFIG